MSFNVSDSPDWGRFLSAKKKYAMQEIIIEEAPLLVGPLGIKTFSFDEAEGDVTLSVKTCISCFKEITDIVLLSTCPECGWWVCCEACSNEPFHKKYECVVFKSNNIKANNKAAFGVLNIIRGCMMYKDKENPQNWQNFTTLSSKLDRQTDYFKEVLEGEIMKATKWINDVCKLDVDATTVGMIVRSILVNSFAIKPKDENGSSYQAQFIYTTGSLFAHSCSPNAEWIILASEQNGIKRWVLRVYAMRNISLNEAITIQYMHDSLHSDTPTRRKYMEDNYNFFCRCERCMDKTEFSFYTSALKCSECGNTNLLPDDPMDANSTWTCGVCMDCYDSEVMNGYVEVYENYLNSVIKLSEIGNAKSVEKCLDLLINSSDRRNLTSNHKVIIRTIYYWLKLQNFEDLLEHTNQSKMKFIKILKRAKKCVEIFRMFGTLRSAVYLEMVFANAIATYYFKTGSVRSIEYDTYSPEEKQQIVTAVYTHMKTAVNIIRCIPYHEINGFFRNTALLQFTFWVKEYNALKGVQNVAIKSTDDTTSSTGLQRNGGMKTFNQVTTYLGTFWTWGWAHLLRKDKPDVSLLSQYDFYYNN